MAISPDDRRVELPCPACGNTMGETIGWFRSHNAIDCAACGTTINLGSDFRSQLEAVAKQAGDGRQIFMGLTIRSR
jgi:predicted RNA-binding Zn-ribbon protein involved in translation (DUF1610 family)